MSDRYQVAVVSDKYSDVYSFNSEDSARIFYERWEHRPAIKAVAKFLYADGNLIERFFFELVAN